MSLNVDPQVSETWQAMAKHTTEDNWMLSEFTMQEKKPTLAFYASGSGGINEMREKLGEHNNKALFGLLKVLFYDAKNAGYEKFIYVRYLGSKIKVMTKGRLTPNMGKIDDCFPVCLFFSFFFLLLFFYQCIVTVRKQKLKINTNKYNSR